MDELTDRQREVLVTIYEHVIMYGKPPTVRDLQEQFGVTSPNGMICHLKALEAKGCITRDMKSSRGIHLVGCRVTVTFDDTPEGERLRSLVGASGPLLTDDEAATAMGVTPQAFAVYATFRDFPEAVGVGEARRWRKGELRAWAAKSRVLEAVRG